jgi:hypothetical protein
VTELRAVGSPGNATGNSMFNIVKRWQFMLVVVQVLKNDQHRRRCVFIQGRRISKADAAMSRWVIAAGLKLIVVPVDSTWMRRSLASVVHQNGAGNSAVSVWHHPGLQRSPMWSFPLGLPE